MAGGFRFHPLRRLAEQKLRQGERRVRDGKNMANTNPETLCSRQGSWRDNFVTIRFRA